MALDRKLSPSSTLFRQQLKTAQTPGTDIRFHENENILVLQTKQGFDVTLDEATEVYRACKKLVPLGKVKMLVDPRGMSGHRSEARVYFASGEVADMVGVMAVISDSAAIYLLTNFFIKVTKPSYPTRIFRKENEAMEWLRNFVLN